MTRYQAPFPDEVRERAVRLVPGPAHEYRQWAANRSMAEKIGVRDAAQLGSARDGRLP